MTTIECQEASEHLAFILLVGFCAALARLRQGTECSSRPLTKASLDEASHPIPAPSLDVTCILPANRLFLFWFAFLWYDVLLSSCCCCCFSDFPLLPLLLLLSLFFSLVCVLCLTLCVCLFVCMCPCNSHVYILFCSPFFYVFFPRGISYK